MSSDRVKDQGTRDGTLKKPITRRSFLKKSAVGAAAAFATASVGPWVRTSNAAKLEISWLGWEHYNVKTLTAEFEKENNCKVSAGFFDGNSECYNKLRAGGTKDFDLFMADGFWPRLYYKQGISQAVDYGKISNLKYCFPDFLPPNYMLLQEEGGTNMVAAPNCWGGYGFSVNTDKIPDEDSSTVYLLFNEKYKGHLSTSARFEENIALAAILACYRMGTMDKERPNGKSFNPYVLYDNELEECKRLLIKQKPLLVTRWNDEDTLERLFRAEIVWASPEWSGVSKRIIFDRLDGKTHLNFKHVLRPKEGGLGWVDTWGITSGVKSSEKLELCHKWIDFRLRKKTMVIVAKEIGWSPTVDVRDMLPQRHIDTLFLDQTSAIKGLFQFDAPSSPEKWERVWSEVEAA